MIDFDFSTIHKCSVIDTCAILNLLSSSRFYTATINETFFWCYTSFVEYEVFYKSVKKETSIIIKQRQNDAPESVTQVRGILFPAIKEPRILF